MKGGSLKDDERESTGRSTSNASISGGSSNNIKTSEDETSLLGNINSHTISSSNSSTIVADESCNSSDINSTGNNSYEVAAVGSGGEEEMSATTINEEKCSNFLRLTYDMITLCDPNLATWANDGMSFVIKQPKEFASKVLPQYFKNNNHKNFSSFVETLYCFGFYTIGREVSITTDTTTENIQSLETSTANDIDIKSFMAETSKEYWEFEHEHFVKDKPELINQIIYMAGGGGYDTTTEASEFASDGSDTSSTDYCENDFFKMKDQANRLENDVDQLKNEIKHMKDMVNSQQKELNMCLNETARCYEEHKKLKNTTMLLLSQECYQPAGSNN